MTSNSRRNTTKESQMTESEDEAVLILHKGRYAKQVLSYPRVETFTIARGWNQTMIEAFRNAIHTVVEANPILSGRLYQDRKGILYVKYRKVYVKGDEVADKFVTLQRGGQNYPFCR